MVEYNKGVLTFTGTDLGLVKKYAKVHKLAFDQVVYLALMNGIVKGYFNEKKPSKKRMVA